VIKLNSLDSQLSSVSTVIGSVGKCVIRYPDNTQIMSKYSSIISPVRARDMGKSIITYYLDQLESSIDEIKNVKNKNLQDNIAKWKESIQNLRKNLFNKKVWDDYFTSYQRTITTTNEILSDIIIQISKSIDSNEALPYEGNYLIQLIKLVRDVLTFFYKVADKAKKSIFPFSPSSLMLFGDIMESYISITSILERLIQIVKIKQELSDEFEEIIIVYFSKLNLNIVKGYSLFGFDIDEIPLSKDTEEILNGYSNESQINFA
jgi:hypothetical protein